MTPTPIGGDEARRLAEQELSRPEYRQGDGSLLQRVLDAVDRFLSGLTGGGGSGVVLAVVGLVVVALVVVAAVRAGRVPGRRRRAAEAADPLATTAGVDHGAAADRLAAAGEHRAAVREYLRAVVADLEHRGVLTPRPGRTGAAAAAEGGHVLPGARESLAAGAAAFDQTWFGGRAATGEDVAAARGALAAVRDPDPAARR